jgi:hypothetical protein
VLEEDVETLRLPLSGLRYQRRSDCRWRCLQPGQYDDEQAGRELDPDSWVSPDLPVEGGGRAEWAPGSHDGASWWLLYGDSRDGPVMVTLSDGRTPPILTFGPLWLCEWVSPWQEALVSVAGESRRVFHRVPGYIQSRADLD